MGKLVRSVLRGARSSNGSCLPDHVRQYRASQYNTAQGRGFKTLIKPSKDAIKRHYRQLAETVRRNKAAQQTNLIGLLNPIIAGWSNYYRAVVSTEIFQTLDHQLYCRLARWARFRHPRKSRHWIVNRYWGVNGSVLNLDIILALQIRID
jgi:RNA-directed DNA polymerase